MSETVRLYEPLWPQLEFTIAGKQPNRRLPKANEDGWIGPVHSPLREDKHPSFSVKADSEIDPGAWKDHATGEGGSIADLARRLGVLPFTGPQAVEPPRVQSFADFCAERHLDADRLKRDWHIRVWSKDGRPGLLFPAGNSYRIKFLDGRKPKCTWKATGGALCYGLSKAKAHGGDVLYIVNGEPSVWAAHQEGVPAICFCAGEGTAPTAEITDELRQSGFLEFAVVYDLDEAGRSGAQRVVVALRDGDLSAKALQLPADLGVGGDVDDLHRRVGDGLRDALAALPDLDPDPPRPASTPRLLKPTEETAPWPEAQPLHRDLEPPDPYPVEALGGILAGAIQVVTRIVQPPAATAAHSVLAAASLAAQGHADVEIDGRRVPLSNYVISVLESGGRKSATDRVVLAEHRAFEKELVLAYKENYAAYDIQRSAWEKAREDALRGKGGREDKEAALRMLGSPPPEPLHPQLITEEPTYEGVVKYLAGGRPSIGIFSDEGGRFLGGNAMNAENRMKTMSGLSGLWDAQPITRTRSGDGSIVLYGRRLAMHLMMQPIVAPTLLADPLAQQQGLAARCLVAWPESNLGSQLYVADDPDRDPKFMAFRTRMRDLLTRPLPTSPHDPRELEPRALTLSPGAHTLWVRFHDWVQGQLRAEGTFRRIAPFAAKAAEHALRIAGVLVLVGDPEGGEVNEAAVGSGIELARFYLGETLRLHQAAATNPTLIAAGNLLQWLKARGQFVALPDIYQYGPARVRDKATAKRLMEVLEQHGWVRRVPGGAEINGARRRDVWEVRP